MKFCKMHGIGNDFIVIDLIKDSYDEDWSAFAVKYCDRNTGIGADGVLLVEPSERGSAFMRLINADGSHAEMCGNGIRCVARYMMERHDVSSPVKVDTPAGLMTIERVNGQYRVDMGVGSLQGDSRVAVAETSYVASKVSMGNPHAVIFVDDFDFDWMKHGKRIEHDSQFPKRTNVEFVKVLSDSELDVKVWERGAGATLACGTGACASLVAAHRAGKAGKRATIHLRGGDLEVEIVGDRVFMTGPAEFVFEGSLSNA